MADRFGVLHSEICGNVPIEDEPIEYEAMLCWTTKEEVDSGKAGKGMYYSWWCPRCDQEHRVSNDEEVGRELAPEFKYKSPFDLV